MSTIDVVVMSLKIYISVLKRKTSLGLMLKHKTSCSFSGLATARVEINSTPALRVIARAWLRHSPALRSAEEGTSNAVGKGAFSSGEGKGGQGRAWAET